MPQVTATTSPAAISSRQQQLGNDNTDGVFIQPLVDSAGNPSKVTLFGPPTGAAAGTLNSGLQVTGGANAALTRGTAGGMVATFATTATPAAIATLTSAEVTLTPVLGSGAMVTVTTTDILVLNKPTSQAGLGYGNVRYASSSTIALSFNNITAGTLTPTTTQIYGVVALRGLGAATTTLTPAAVATKTTAEQLFTVSGIRAGELVIVNKPTTNVGLDIVGCRVAGNNQIGITFANFTAGTLTPTAAEAYTIQSLGGVDAASAVLLAQIPIVGGTIATVTTAEITLTSGNYAAQDVPIGVSKPTLQQGLIAGSVRLASSTTMGVTFANPTAGTLTPTAAEVLGIAIDRQAPAAPVVIYSPTLTPTSVAANTTAEQTFTVTGLIAGSPVWVNKPTAQAGLGIVGARVSAASTLAINFLNTTAGTLTPTAAEVYTVGNFQMPIDTTTGNSWIQPAVPALTAAATLANALRSNDVSLGIFTGS